MKLRKNSKKIAAIMMTASVSCTLAIPTPVVADDEIPESVATEVADYTSRVEETAQAYDEAITHQNQIEQELSALEAEITEKETEIPVLEKRAAETIVAVYKNGDGFLPLLELVLESENLSEAMQKIEYYSRVMDHYNRNMALMHEIRFSLNADKEKKQFDLKAAEEATSEAENALEEAKEARKQAVEEAIARQKAQEEEAARALRANGEHGSTPGISAGEIDWNVDKETFVSEWGKRIDTYLSGSNMEGCGTTYATAAWNYGVDPRWAPAISCVESGKGSVCFRQYNAWGYGSRNFASWEDGIDTVVKALGSSLYGGYLSYSAARTYCPPNADYWYTWCASEMSSI